MRKVFDVVSLDLATSRVAICDSQLLSSFDWKYSFVNFR